MFAAATFPLFFVGATSFFFPGAAFLFIAVALPSFVAVVKGACLGIGVLEVMKAESGSGHG